MDQISNMGGIGSLISNVVRGMKDILKILDYLLCLNPYGSIKDLTLHLVGAYCLPDHLYIGKGNEVSRSVRKHKHSEIPRAIAPKMSHLHSGSMGQRGLHGDGGVAAWLAAR